MTPIQIDFPSLFTKEQLDYIGQCVVEKAQDICGEKLRDVILFGSYARGDFKEWSDVDIMILVNADDLECKRMDSVLMKSLSDLDHQMNLLLSFVVTSHERYERMKDTYPYYRNINKEGRCLCSMTVA